MQFNEHVTFDELLTQIERDPERGPLLIAGLGPVAAGMRLSAQALDRDFSHVREPALKANDPHATPTTTDERIDAIDAKHGAGGNQARILRDLKACMDSPEHGDVISSLLGKHLVDPAKVAADKKAAEAKALKPGDVGYVAPVLP
jgi:hypothetical protein